MNARLIYLHNMNLGNLGSENHIEGQWTATNQTDFTTTAVLALFLHLFQTYIIKDLDALWWHTLQRGNEDDHCSLHEYTHYIRLVGPNG